MKFRKTIMIYGREVGKQCDYRSNCWQLDVNPKLNVHLHREDSLIPGAEITRRGHIERKDKETAR